MNKELMVRLMKVYVKYHTFANKCCNLFNTSDCFLDSLNDELFDVLLHALGYADDIDDDAEIFNIWDVNPNFMNDFYDDVKRELEVRNG